jgi:hypothetical protein
MATRKREPKAKQTRSKADSEPLNERRSKEAEENEDGFEILRCAADAQLGRRSGEIAEALGKKAADGDLNSAKFLLTVAEKKGNKNARKMRRGLLVAQSLAREPPWEERLETKTEFGSDGGEPAN